MSFEKWFVAANWYMVYSCEAFCIEQCASLRQSPMQRLALHSHWLINDGGIISISRL